MPIVNIFTNLVDIFIKKKHFTNNVTFFPLSDNSSKSTEQILDTMISELHLYKMDDLLKLKNILEQYEDKNFRPLHMVLLDLKFQNEIFNEFMLKLFNNKLERFQVYMVLDQINLRICNEIRYTLIDLDDKPTEQELLELLKNDGIAIYDESIIQKHIKELCINQKYCNYNIKDMKQ
jgi:hypothetical protein